jgi:hypothetical protein
MEANRAFHECIVKSAKEKRGWHPTYMSARSAIEPGSVGDRQHATSVSLTSDCAMWRFALWKDASR